MDAAAIAISAVVTAIIVFGVLGVFVWAARADGRDQRRYDWALREWLRRHGRGHTS